jgi:hypothetical protein
VTRSPSILFAGGCHVKGFPVGPEHSLARVALRSIGHPRSEDPDVLVYLNLRAGPALEQACRDRNTEILVLQLGHYETLPKLKRMFHLGPVSGLGSSSSSSSSPRLIREPTPDPSAHFELMVGERLVFARRLALGAAFRAVGLSHRVFNVPAVESALDVLLSGLSALPLKAILLLSPFSCPDPLTRSSRRLAEGIFAQAARNHGCVFVNTFELLESCAQGEPFFDNFADANHLSRFGHQRVGRLVGDALRHTIDAL